MNGLQTWQKLHAIRKRYFWWAHKNVINMDEHIFKNLLKLTSELSVATRITFICPMTFNSFPLDVQVCLFQVFRKRQVQSAKKNMTFNKIIAMHCKYNNPTYSPQSILSDLAKFYPNLFEANFWQSPGCFQVGSFNYDNTKMVFNDSFIAEEGAIRWFFPFFTICVKFHISKFREKKKQIIAMNIKCLYFLIGYSTLQLKSFFYPRFISRLFVETWRTSFESYPGSFAYTFEEKDVLLRNNFIKHLSEASQQFHCGYLWLE